MRPINILDPRELDEVIKRPYLQKLGSMQKSKFSEEFTKKIKHFYVREKSNKKE